MPVVPASQEAETGESLQPGKQKLQWAEIASLHSSLGNKSESPLQKIKIKIKMKGANVFHLREGRRTFSISTSHAHICSGALKYSKIHIPTNIAQNHSPSYMLKAHAL